MEIETIINTVLNKSNLESNAIPSLDLYMDQIMTLFEDNLQDNKRFEDDKLLTKTMINNYSKAGVIKPVKGKKYTKEQIIGMLVIYSLKNTITIQEIKQLLTPLYEADNNLEDIYDQFIDINKQLTTVLEPFITSLIDNNDLSIDNDTNRLITIMVLSSLSNYVNGIITNIIDNVDSK